MASLKQIVIDGIIAAIQAIFEIIENTVGKVITGLLKYLTHLITDTPYPKSCGSDGACRPLVFGVPPEGLWNTMYGIYFEKAQPYAYVLWFVTLVSIQFVTIFDELIPGFNADDTKQRLFIAFFGITFWWPLGVIILGFADGLTELLMSLGATGKADGIGLADTYEIANRGLKTNNNIAGLIIVTLLWAAELIILIIMALLWTIRLFVIYVGMPLMPIAIALWAFKLPGLKPLNTLGEKGLSGFMTLAFVTIPGALIVGFTGQIMHIVATESQTAKNAEGIKDGGGGIDTSDPTPDDASIVIDSPNPTSDPVGALSNIQSAASDPTAHDISQTAAAPATPVPDGFVFSLIFAIGISTLPIIAALGPFLIAKALPGAKMGGGVVGALANPAGALYGAAKGAAGAKDSMEGLKEGYKVARGVQRGDLDKSEAVKGALGSDYIDDEGEFKEDKDISNVGLSDINWSSLKGNRKQTVASMEDAGLAGFGAMVGGGMRLASQKASKTRQQASDLATSGVSGLKSTTSSMANTMLATLHDPEDMVSIASENTKKRVRNGLGMGADAAKGAASSANDAKNRTLDRINSRAQGMRSKVSGAGNELHAMNKKWEESSDYERRLAFGNNLRQESIEKHFDIDEDKKAKLDEYHSKGEMVPEEELSDIFDLKDTKAAKKQYLDYKISTKLGDITSVSDVVGSMNHDALQEAIPELEFSSPADMDTQAIANEFGGEVEGVLSASLDEAKRNRVNQFESAFEDIGRNINVESRDDVEMQLGIEQTAQQAEINWDELPDGIENRTVEASLDDSTLEELNTDIDLSSITMGEFERRQELNLSDAIQSDAGKKLQNTLKVETHVEDGGFDNVPEELMGMLEETQHYTNAQETAFEMNVSTKLESMDNAMDVIGNGLTIESMREQEMMQIMQESGMMGTLQLGDESAEANIFNLESGAYEMSPELHQSKDRIDQVLDMVRQGHLEPEAVRDIGELEWAAP